ncbi:MAG: ATP-dependent DNA helicase Rep [Gammaproteobacteria bacterium]|jgi:ATP-dependent DNA helicase Rep
MNLQDMNQPQQDAVTCTDRPCLVLAGAGSGKTRVITRKISYLIEVAQFKPEHVRALTFTNKAAREMKQRLASAKTGKGKKGPVISTFHTLGLNILQQEFYTLGLRRGFSIMDAKDVESCLTELTHREEFDNSFVKNTLYQISRWKNDFIGAVAASKLAEDDLQLQQARIYDLYQQHLKTCNAVDFDDLIMLPVNLLRNEESILSKWQGKIRYLLVDEYQDTNTSQYEMIHLISGLRQNLTVVGDDDQSIYAWRGARPENINRLHLDFPQLKVIKLEQNYRSSGRILNAANQLISNNEHLFDKKLWTAAPPGDYIRIMPCKNADDEASRIATDIMTQRLQNNRPFRDFAILYRSNFQSRIYEKALRDHSIPYQITGSTAFFERREIKDIMAYLRLVTNPDDDQALLRIINLPRREIGTGTIQTIATYAAKRHNSLGAILSEMGLGEQLTARARARVNGFADLIEQLRHQANQVDAMVFIKHLIATIDYPAWLAETSGSQKQADVALENIEELVSWIGNLQKNAEDKSIQNIVTRLALMSILQNNEDQKEQDAVQLMTLHAAKGLEFPDVYLSGFEEDSLPHHQSQDPQSLEEERRLAYVGITRAEVNLTISYAKLRQKFGETQHCEPSRFLLELPEADIEGAEHTASKLSAEEKHEKGLNTFANLQAMLSTSKG